MDAARDREQQSEVYSNGGLAPNGFDAHSAGGYTMMAGLTTGVVLTLFFQLILLGATGKRVLSGFAPIAIGLGLTQTHLSGCA